jgi:hypothetical protein
MHHLKVRGVAHPPLALAIQEEFAVLAANLVRMGCRVAA